MWGYVAWLVYDTEFLAGFWGLTNDEIAVVTIERGDSGNEDTITETIVIQDPSKSFWDGLELLGVPLVLAVLGAWFQKTQQEQAERTAREQREQDADETREEVLQLYFDRISTLLIDKNLMAIASKGDDAPSENKELLEASLDIIRARTLSILRRFENDIDRKSSVVRFLAEAEIISRLKLNLSEAQLSEAQLNAVNLNGGNFNRANFTKAQLNGANLDKAQLNGAILNGAQLQGAILNDADLCRAQLNETKLKWAFLIRSDLTSAKLNGADLTKAKLHSAKLNGTDLTRAKLVGAKLIEAELEWAFFVEANLKGADLKKINFDASTTWPEKENVTKAKNIPIELQKRLGLIPELPQKQPSDQSPSKEPQQDST